MPKQVERRSQKRAAAEARAAAGVQAMSQPLFTRSKSRPSLALNVGRLAGLFPFLLVSMLLSGCAEQTELREPAADLIIRNARILTMAEQQPQAQALAVRAGRIVFVGTDSELDANLERWRDADTELIDAGGSTVLPGLIDTHSHPVIGADQLEDCSLDDQAMPLSAMQPLITECLKRLPAAQPDAWLAIINLSPAGFSATAADLDQLVSDRPFALFGTDGHTAWVNHAGLRAAGIDRNTADPAGGKIVRDADGNASGRLIDTAVELAYGKLPKKSLAEQMRLLAQAQRDMHAVGLTTVLEASANRDILAVYKALAEQGKLSLKISAALTSEANPDPAHLNALEALRSEFAGVANLQVDTVKVFADGVLEHPTQSAALLSPYLHGAGSDGGSGAGDAADHAGELYFEPAKMAAFVAALDQRGFHVHVHAIGDAAVRASLDAFASARQRNGAKSQARFSISHLELIDPADWPRFKAHQVFASFQLLWGQPDAYSVEAVQPYLGNERSQWLYPAGGLHKAGASIAAGSDWNVSTFDPWQAMAVGLCRCNADEPDRPPLVPEQALPLDVMLRAYTIEAARMLGREQDIGSLELGKSADLIVLDGSLVSESGDVNVKAEQLRRTVVRATLSDGQWRYRR